MDRKIEAVFTALLDGATPESLKENGGKVPEGQGDQDGKKTAPADGFPGKGKKENKKSTKKFVKGDPRIIVECVTVEEIVFQHEKDPDKVFGRRKNRAARGVIEKPEDWRSVDMVDDVNPPPPPKASSGKDSVHSESAEDDDLNSNDSRLSDAEEDEEGGGVSLKDNIPADADTPDTIPLSSASYGFGGGKVRPPQSQSSINGSIGGEKGWAERIEETDDMKAKRREGQKRADEREMVRRAARRLVAFGPKVKGESGSLSSKEKEKGKGEVGAEDAGRKCEAVMKGVVVEASFAKGEWGIRWREKV